MTPYCSNCKHFLPHKMDWNSEEYQIKHALCTRAAAFIAPGIPTYGTPECDSERRDHWFRRTCGRSAQFFQPKEDHSKLETQVMARSHL